MEAQDDGDGSPDKDIYYDEDGDDSDAVGGDRMKEFRLRWEFDRGQVMKRHDGDDDVKTQNVAKRVYLAVTTLSLEQQWPCEQNQTCIRDVQLLPSLAYMYSTAPLFLHRRVIK